MSEDVKQKIEKIYRLVQQGATDGEKQAATKALDRLMKKHNIDEEFVKTINEKYYTFKYSLELDKWLMSRLISHFLGKKVSTYLDTNGKRELVIKLEYLDFVTLECAYEYFKKHMRKEYKRLVTPQVNRCRTPKTKREKRKELDTIFFSNYIIASKLYKENEIKSLNWSDMSESERKKRMALDGVQGGSYHTQVQTGLYLE